MTIFIWLVKKLCLIKGQTRKTIPAPNELDDDDDDDDDGSSYETCLDRKVLQREGAFHRRYIVRVNAIDWVSLYVCPSVCCHARALCSSHMHVFLLLSVSLRFLEITDVLL